MVEFPTNLNSYGERPFFKIITYVSVWDFASSYTFILVRVSTYVHWGGFKNIYVKCHIVLSMGFMKTTLIIEIMFLRGQLLDTMLEQLAQLLKP